MLCLDEADEMIDSEGQGEMTRKIKNMAQQHKAGHYQILLFSATFPDSVERFAQQFVQQAVRIKVEREKLTLDGIQQLYINCGAEERKFEVLKDIYGYSQVGQSIIFVHTRRKATELSQRMNAEGFQVSVLHGEQQPAERDKCIGGYP